MAAEDVVRDPSEEDAQKTLHFQVKKLLQEDQELALDIARLYGVKAGKNVQIGDKIGGVHIENSTFINTGTVVGGNKINKEMKK